MSVLNEEKGHLISRQAMMIRNARLFLRSSAALLLVSCQRERGSSRLRRGSIRSNAGSPRSPASAFRGTFRSVRGLVLAIHDYVRSYNRNPQPFHWVASASRIIRKSADMKQLQNTAERARDSRMHYSSEGSPI